MDEKNDYIAAVPLDIWVMNADDSDKVQLTNNGAVHWAPSWHPDGNRVIFSSNMDDWREDIQQYGHNFDIDFDWKNVSLHSERLWFSA